MKNDCVHQNDDCHSIHVFMIYKNKWKSLFSQGKMKIFVRIITLDLSAWCSLISFAFLSMIPFLKSFQKDLMDMYGICSFVMLFDYALLSFFWMTQITNMSLVVEFGVLDMNGAFEMEDWGRWHQFWFLNIEKIRK